MVLNRRLKHQNTEASRVIYLLGDQAKAVTLAMVLQEGNKEFRYCSCIALGCNQKSLKLHSYLIKSDAFELIRLLLCTHRPNLPPFSVNLVLDLYQNGFQTRVFFPVSSFLSPSIIHHLLRQLHFFTLFFLFFSCSRISNTSTLRNFEVRLQTHDGTLKLYIRYSVCK